MRERKTYHVYIVASRARTLYIGTTSKLEQRTWQHKHKTFAGFTARYNCERLVWYEAFAYAQSAIAREKQLKHWRREKKEALITRNNPTWEDLSANWGKPIEPFREREITVDPSTPLRSGRDDTHKD